LFKVINLLYIVQGYKPWTEIVQGYKPWTVIVQVYEPWKIIVQGYKPWTVIVQGYSLECVGTSMTSQERNKNDDYDQSSSSR
jgi:hypothetical protein